MPSSPSLVWLPDSATCAADVPGWCSSRTLRGDYVVATGVAHSLPGRRGQSIVTGDLRLMVDPNHRLLSRGGQFAPAPWARARSQPKPVADQL